ncbi:MULTISPECIES: Fic family protein [Pasteurellaceae]|uniref:protein adenylyltransferase n=1 Tax=Pasteurella atlantica TaxID=2827233 RepID=A0AAW8CP95_9PAST|nr:Fic family protein [Pasteurella atlantica]MBR0574252.1 Fic family protein [Pasteurella atlantica]MDP8038540.1 Fic family protein [Pasteurella atlantica]MDP8040632.1 Fic family protein [Pasteurella atlantica]MDP8042766.1 Fic family protein [Pasteurella atlantica]MDP8044854.1 Fic family protein [Pasteurella atlantica]
MLDNAYNNFDEYLKQGEPDKIQKANVWKTAIGLQQVDGLVPSDYLIQTAKQNIEGDISIEEVKLRIDSYYEQFPIKNDINREEEADKVSARIAQILNEQTFAFSPTEFLSIHRRLFENIYPNAGKIRDYNITKKEWILDGETVLYGSAYNLKDALEYDFEQEKKFSYRGLSQQGIIEHIASFISYLWQIHIFEEGNTRTVAIFLIKYLRKLGFKEVNNTLFEKHSWYFRNALVRANYEDVSKSIYPTQKYLIHFLCNLLLGKDYILKNRELHIRYNDTLNLKNDTVNDTVFNEIKKNNKATANQIAEILNISLSTVKRRIKVLKDTQKIQRIGSDKTGYWKIK